MGIIPFTYEVGLATLPPRVRGMGRGRQCAIKTIRVNPNLKIGG